MYLYLKIMYIWKNIINSKILIMLVRTQMIDFFGEFVVVFHLYTHTR